MNVDVHLVMKANNARQVSEICDSYCYGTSII